MAEFDVFLSHNSKDKPAVRELAAALRARGLQVWVDEDYLVPGRPWQKALEKIIQTARTAAVLIGKDGLGPWEEPEMRGCLSEFVGREMPVIPVLLPDAPSEPELPLFLKGFTWVDLRGGLTDAGLDRLVWGITGEKPPPPIDPKGTERRKAHPPRTMRSTLLRILPWLAGLLALAVIVWWVFKPPLPGTHSALDLARHAMASGRYPEALKHYQDAKALDAGNPDAVFGAQKAALAEKIAHAEHDDPAGFRAELQTLRENHPHDADLSMLEGDLLYRDPLGNKRALARAKYEEALRENPRLAEAHFRLGVLSAQEGDKAEALKHYEEANRLEPMEAYQDNIAEQDLLLENYAEAVKIYESLNELPLARLEAAKGLWALGRLQEALAGQRLALRWLEDPKVAALPKNQVRWRLDLPDGARFNVATAACKHYYAELALTASRVLLREEATLSAAGECEDEGKIRQAIAEDARRFALVQTGQKQAGQALIALLAGR